MKPEHDKVVDTLSALVDVAKKNGHCASLYQMDEDTIAAICLKPSTGGKFCPDCEDRKERRNQGDDRKYRLVKEEKP